MDKRKEIDKRSHGALYETRAREYLIDRNYRWVAQNVNFKSGEIDLIFEEKRGSRIELVFVEVRKRAASGWVSAEESVTYPKQRTLKNAIAQYLRTYSGLASTMRIDLIAFEGEQLRHYPNFIHYQ